MFKILCQRPPAFQGSGVEEIAYAFGNLIVALIFSAVAACLYCIWTWLTKAFRGTGDATPVNDGRSIQQSDSD